MGSSRYVGRVGALALALGIGSAMASPAGVAWADVNGASPTTRGDASGEAAAPGGADPEVNTVDRETATDNVNPSVSQDESYEERSAAEDDPRDEDTSSSQESDRLDNETLDSVDTEPTNPPAESGSLDNQPVEPPTDVDHPVLNDDDTDASIDLEPAAVPVLTKPTPTRSGDPELERASQVRSIRESVSSATTFVASPADIVEPRPVRDPEGTVGDVAPVADAAKNRTDSSDAPVTSASVAATLVSALLIPGAPGVPSSPVESPLLWGLTAFARRQFGQRPPAIESQQAPTFTSQLLDQLAGESNSAPVQGTTTQSRPGFLTGSVRGRVSASDADDDRLRFGGTSTTAKGFVQVSRSGVFTYTPTAAARHAAAAVGATAAEKTDTFTVTVTDGKGGVTSIPVTVTIAARNATPIVASVRAGRPDATTGAVTITASAFDIDRDTLTYTAQDTAKGTLVDNGSGRFTFTPTAAARNAAAAPGAPATAQRDTVTITITDAHGGTTVTNVAVRIAPLAASTNSAPANGTSASGQPNPATGAVTGKVTATDPDSDPLTYSAPTSSAKGGAVTVSADGTFTYTPTAPIRHVAAANDAAAADKQDTFTVTVSDGKGGTLAVPVTVTISPANVAPTGNYTASQPNNTTGAVMGQVTSTDADNDTRIYTGPTTSAKGGTVAINADGTFAYTPSATARQNAAKAGATATDKTDTFVVTVADGHIGGATTVTVSVAVLPAPNSAPTGGGFTTGAPGVNGTVTGRATATDTNGDTLTYSGPFSSVRGGLVAVSADGTFTYTPTAATRHLAAANTATAADTQDSFTITVSDGRGGSLTVPITVTISPSNSAPVGNYAAGQPNTDTGTVSGQVTSTDADGDTRAYTGPTTSAKGGTVIVNADGTFSYTPTAAARDLASAPNATAADRTDTFAVTISDGHVGGTTSVTLTVAVAPTSQGPVTTTPAPGFPLSAPIVGGNGYTYQFIQQLGQGGGVPSTGLIVRASNGTQSVSDFVPGLATIDATLPPVPRSDGSITVLLTTFDTANPVRVATFTAGGDVVVANTNAPRAALYTADGTLFLVSPVEKAVTVGDETNTETSFKISRIGADGTLIDYVYDTGPAQYAKIIGKPVVGPDNTVYVTFNNYSDPAQPAFGGAYFLTSHAAVLSVTSSGVADVHFISSATGSGVDNASSAGDVAVGGDGTVYATASTRRGSLIWSSTLSDGTATLEVPGYVTRVKAGGPYAAINWVDDEGVARTSLITSRGIVATFNDVGNNFVMGPDGTIYTLPEGDGSANLIASTPNGTRNYALGGSASLDPAVAKFTADGTLFLLVGDAENNTLSLAAPTRNFTSGPLALRSAQEYQFQIIDNNAVLTARTTSGVVILVVDSTGTLLAMNEVSADNFGPTTIGSDGIIYTAGTTTKNNSGGVPSFETTIYSITSDATEIVRTVDGVVSGLVNLENGQIVSTTATFVVNDDIVSGTTVLDTVVTPAPAVPSITTRILDRVAGTVSGKVTADPSFGDAVYSGSTTNPLGTIVVNADGTYTYTPSAAARRYVQETEQITNAIFFVTVTNAAGRTIQIPVSVPLIAVNFPTLVSEQTKLPLITVEDLYREYALSGTSSNVGSALEWKTQKLVLTNKRDVVTAPCTTSDACSDPFDYRAIQITYTETGNPPIVASPNLDAPAFADVYVVEVLHLPGQYYNEGTVVGFRKMARGDSILIKNDEVNSDRVSTDGIVKTSYITHIGVGVPYGTFPEDQFYERVPGVVGGNMFDNELEPNDYTAIQQDEFDEFSQQYAQWYADRVAAAQNAGEALQILGPLALSPLRTFKQATKAGVKTVLVTWDSQSGDNLRTVTDPEELNDLVNSNPSSYGPLITGQKFQATPPRGGIPG